MSVLVVEDEINLLNALKRGLTDSGFAVSIATNGNTGLEMALKHSFSVIVLDIMLPGIDGMELCKQLRINNIKTPIIMLTALDSTENIVSALDSGADDYLTKPFQMPELAARLRTLQRRNGNGVIESEKLKIANLEVDLDAKTVTCNQEVISLTATEYRLLLYLLKNQNKVLTRIQILDQVWDIDFNLGTNVVDVYINYLRKKIEKKTNTKLIHTVFGMGYMMKYEDSN